MTYIVYIVSLRKQQTMEVENWKVIDECPDYEVSDQGRVRNLKSGLVMKISVKDGYSGICLVKDEGKRIRAKVHLPDRTSRANVAFVMFG